MLSPLKSLILYVRDELNHGAGTLRREGTVLRRRRRHRARALRGVAGDGDGDDRGVQER